MLRLLLSALLAIIAFPASAQTATAQHAGSSTAAAVPAIDPALVGRWVLTEVEDHGALEAFSATVEAMACQFGADGEASVGVMLEQDADTYTRERAFRFVTADGQILADGADGASYEMIGPDELRLTMNEGLVVRLQRTAP